MLSLSCLAAVTVFASQEDQKPVSAKPKPAPVVTKFYRLTELSGLLQSHPFQGKLPGAAGANVGNLASRPAGNHGSNAPTTGGGMFNVPSPPQGGGLGGGGFGGGGMGFGVNSSRRKYSADSQAVQSAIDLLEQFVEPDSWQDNGGRGVIVPVRQTLMIRTTEDVHKSIRAFLNDLTNTVVGGQPLQIDAWWLPLNPGERRRLQEILQTDWSNEAEAKQGITNLAELTESSGGHHGSLRSRAGHPVHATGGYRRPLVVGSVPVVGTGTSIHQPIMQSVNYGIMLELTPTLVANWRQLNPEEKNSQGERISLNLKTSLTGVGPNDLTDELNEPGQVDRYDIGAHVLQTVAVCPMNTPTVMGSLAAVGLPPIEGDDKNEIFVVIRVRR